jgi:hypothetical protein
MVLVSNILIEGNDNLVGSREYWIKSYLYICLEEFYSKVSEYSSSP